MRSPFPALHRDMLRFCALATIAAGLFAAMPARAEHSPEEAQAFIQNLAQQAISTVAERQISDAERNDRFRKLFVSAFDLPEISRFVLARYWRTATPEQQQEFVKLFEDMQVLNWAQRFKDYKGENLQVSASAKDGDKGFIVDSQLARPNATPLPVQWKVHTAEDGKIRVTDIVVEGVSMAITQRSDFNSLLQANGGKFDELLKALRTKVDQLRANG
jgi:phospholipid transport system substrate-binding protein